MAFDFLTNLINEDTIKARYFNDGKVKVDEIAKDMINSMHLITIIDNEEILYYEDGIYNRGGNKKVKELLMRKLGKYLKKYHIGEIISQIQGRTYISRDEVNAQHNLIHMNNGIYNIETGEFGDFSPETYTTNKIPVDYDPKATCPQTDKFISEVLNEGDVGIVYELFGYCIYHGYPFQVAFMFVGSGANGKSTLINLFRAFVGKKNISTKSLQDLGNDRFASSNLFGKMANLYPDLSDEGLKRTGIFKALTGGDSIDAQRKFQSSFSFVNHAKLIFSCNKLPRTKDDTDAFFRRWIIIDFPNKFIGKNADKFLMDKITTSKELSGLFNRAMSELSKIVKNGGFSHSTTTESTKERYIRLSNSLRAFILDCVEPDVGSWITKEDFFNAYSEYCRSEDIPIYSMIAVGRSLPSIVSVVEEKRTTPEGRKKAWKGIKFKADGEGDVVRDEESVELDDPRSLDSYDDSNLSQQKRVELVTDILIKNRDGLTEKEILAEVDGRMTKDQTGVIIKRLRDEGSVIQIGKVYQWFK